VCMRVFVCERERMRERVCVRERERAREKGKVNNTVWRVI
jgi:hypothetical protein